jgi:release factor glutamine methyltransferase
MLQTSVGEALARGGRALASTSETASRDAQMLLADLIGKPREWLLSHPEAAVPRAADSTYSSALQQLLAGEPLPYVLGWWEFYGRRFRVTPQVLIPRPETELLVERGLRAIDEHPRIHALLDVGTGSGCVGVTLALERPSVRVVASDVSRAALSVARENADRHSVGNRIAFVMADLTAGFSLDHSVILANLPYVASNEIAGILSEPRLATEGGVTGLEVIGRLLGQLARHRPRRATVLLEIGAGQGSALIDLASIVCRPSRAWVEPDLAGRDRILGLQF